MPPAIDIVDETFLAVPPSTVAAVFAAPGSWTHYWPDLVLRVYTDRGDRGLRWTVRGALTGTMEIWLEEVLDGTLLHYFLRATPVDPLGNPLRLRPAQLRREADRRARAAKAIALGLKLQLEDGRAPGVAPVVENLPPPFVK
ncbi:polyketide cyclase / dehydrase and lipid transport [Amycolatopsis suaedae]|uniref:Polyketide cyclase / dehydrase and lipid transport n=1 Tax=Amycolatopsis suaedae TaxID=2510978 RepID=A0A4Q7J7V2_9PSEU|nr:polyketide cyclase / dehydrase and lipid transport [Amycolatopsis suaedae]